MAKDEIEEFIQLWEHESGVTKDLFKTIPNDKFEFRPDPQGRSIGELAQHIAEVETIFSTIARERAFPGSRPAGLETPRNAADLVSGYERIHRDAVERVRGLRPEDLDREFPFFGRQISVRQVLRFPLLHHQIHHRGQLMMLIRQAGAVPSRVYGPSREESAPAGR